MKTFIGAFALILAVPALGQTAPAIDPHAGHAQHRQVGVQQGHDHAKMMDECKKAMTEGKCKEHCEAMMKRHGAAAAPAKADGHAGHAH